MDTFLGVLFLATVGERLSEVILVPILEFALASVTPNLRHWITRLVCALPGGVIVFAWGQDLFAPVGIVFPGMVGVVLTAILAGFGANYVHEVFSLVRSARGEPRNP